MALHWGDPEVVFGPSVFLEAWGTDTKNPQFVQKLVVFVALGTPCEFALYPVWRCDTGLR